MGLMFMDLVMLLEGCPENVDFELMMITARALWIRRSKLLHNNLFQHPSHELLCMAQNSLEEFQFLMQSSVSNSAITNAYMSWEPPMSGYVKANWDIALDHLH